MSDVIITQLGSLSAAGQAYPVAAKSGGSHTLTVSLVGSGALNFAGALMGSNDNKSWVTAGLISAVGTGVASASIQVTVDFAYWALSATTLTGTGVVAAGVLATDPLQAQSSGGNGASSGPQASGVVSTRQVVPGSSSAAANNTTYGQQIPLGRRFVGFRLVLANYNTGAPCAIDRLKVACQPTDANDGAALTWFDGKVAGSGTILLPAATVGPETQNGATTIPAIAYTDPVYSPALDRTDTPGAQFLLQARAHSATGLLYFNNTAIADADGYSWTQDAGWLWKRSILSGDHVTTPDAMTGWVDGIFSPVVGVELIVGGNTFNMHVYGDSLEAGNLGSAGSQSGWCIRLDSLWRAQGKPGAVANWAHSTMRHGNYIAVMKAGVTASQPDAVFLPCGSPNSATTAAGFELQYAQTLEAVQWLRKRGVKVYLRTQYPSNLAEGVDVYRRAQNQRVINEIGGAGLATVLDLAFIVEDPLVRRRMKAEYNAGDDLHVNAACYDVLAPFIDSQIFIPAAA